LDRFGDHFDVHVPIFASARRNSSSMRSASPQAGGPERRNQDFGVNCRDRTSSNERSIK
jgi:hypothetical protein